MNAYKMELVVQVFYVLAENEEIAEEQYARYHSGMTCYYHDTARLEDETCKCVTVEEDVYHNTELIGRE